MAEFNIFASKEETLEYMRREAARVLGKPYKSSDDEMREYNAHLDAVMLAELAREELTAQAQDLDMGY